MASAQEMEPRAFAPLPIGTNFFVASIGRTSGSVLFDPSVPITDVHSTATAGGFGLGRAFDLFGRQALILGAFPIATMTASGKVQENAASVSRPGLADARVKLSVILVGSDALRPAAFAKQPRRPTLGISLTVATPTGQYEPVHLVNI